MRGFKVRTWWVVAALVAVAFALRTWHLSVAPPGLYLDEAAYGLDGLAVRHGNLAVFYPRNNGREPLFIWLLGLVFSIAGATPYTIRLTAALCGTATVATTYWMVRELMRFESRGDLRAAHRTAAWVALLLALSYWHLSLSRLGFRAITLPLVMTIAFALVWRTWNLLREGSAGGRVIALAWVAGAALGLTFYTYTAGRVGLVLFVALAVATWLWPQHYGIARRQTLRISAQILVAALLVASPLLLYFSRHATEFAEHAAFISIFNERFSGGNPLVALWASTSKTILMLTGLAADPNLRHNPAFRPAVEWFIGIWLVAGAGLALLRWRRPASQFSLLWIGIFLAPVVLSAEGAPHSLRSIGLLPAIFLPPMMAMDWAAARLGAHLSVRWREIAAHWFPLPFVLAAALLAIPAYFGVWEHTDRFRAPFFVDYVRLAQALDNDQARQDLWLLPLPPGEDLQDDAMNTVDFLLRSPQHVITLRLDEATTPARLAEVAQDYETVHVLDSFGVPILAQYETRFMDVKGYLDMLLRRNLEAGATVSEGEVAGFPYRTYPLASERDFALPGGLWPLNVEFGESVRVARVQLDAGDGQAELPVLEQPADRPILAVLRWDATQALAAGIKSSLVLRSLAGDWAGQIDQPLQSDQFPRFDTPAPGETASTYALVQPVPGAPPGRYDLLLSVYDEESGRALPARQSDGSVDTQLLLAEVELLPPTVPFADTEPVLAGDWPLAGEALHLIGLDPPPAKASPGQRLDATLHLAALDKPDTDLRLWAELRTEHGDVVAGDELLPGGESYSTSHWRAGERLRVWAELAVPAELPSGTYEYGISSQDGQREGVFLPLATVTVEGRARLLESPRIDLVAEARFGDVVELSGLTEVTTLEAQPGATLTIPLVWRALATESRELVRFVQLLDSGGALVAQQDTVPCNGECPSTSWLEGEYLLDHATLVLPAGAVAGDYTLVAGWYESATQERLAAATLDGAPLVDNVLRLPVRVQPAE